jgi:uncharacterized damage-inducible protein DinB
VTPPRPEPPLASDEKATLVGYLDYQRATLALKCDGLDAEQLRRRAVPPSALSLLGVVRHMAEVERGWFRQRLAGEQIGYRWVTDDEPNAEFDDVDTAVPAEAFAAWEEECDASRRIVAAASSLDDTFELPRMGTISLRWLLVHMIEEYARHNGHADLLRECIDGATGG